MISPFHLLNSHVDETRIKYESTKYLLSSFLKALMNDLHTMKIGLSVYDSLMS